MVNFLIVTHGEFGAYLIEAAEDIVGRQHEGVRSVSLSTRRSIEEIRRRVGTAVAELKGPSGLVVATDMPGGTPTNVALAVTRGMPGVRVVAGVNLYMLVSGFTARAQDLALEAVAARMLADGSRSIRDMQAALALVR